MPDIGLGALEKVLRWAVRVSAYQCNCIHIRGEENAWANLLIRRYIPINIPRLVSITPLPTTFGYFIWPSTEVPRASRTAYDASRLTTCHCVTTCAVYSMMVHSRFRTTTTIYTWVSPLLPIPGQLTTTDAWRLNVHCSLTSCGPLSR